MSAEDANSTRDLMEKFFHLTLALLCTARRDGNTFENMNPAWMKTLGWTKEELTSKSFIEFIHPDDVQPTFDVISKMDEGVPAIYFENRYRHKNGSWVWLSWVSILTGGTYYAAAIDVTPYKNTQELLKVANKELEERAHCLAEQKKELEQAQLLLTEKANQLALTSKYKSDFLTNMSHELRTPLNSMLLLSHILTENAEGTLTPKQLEYASVIHSAGNDLLTLITDILDLSRIEAGKVEVILAATPLARIVDFIERTFQPVAKKKDLAWKTDLSPALPPAIETDETRLLQILKNFLSNAFKFTEKGEVSFHIGLSSKGLRVDQRSLSPKCPIIAFSVCDTGIGIEKEKQALIFEVFQQADAGTIRKYGGSGLGLSISRELAYLLGGQITLESEVGVGSAFTLTLPCVAGRREREDAGRAGKAGIATSAIADTPAFSPDARVAKGALLDRNGPFIPDPNLAGRKILIVDDDIRNLFSLTAVLEGRKMAVLTAGSGNEALKILMERSDLEIILIDIMMPEMDGYEVTRKIREIEAYRKRPIIALTAKAIKGDREKCLEAGTSDYVTKPVAVELLLTTLEKWLV